MSRILKFLFSISIMVVLVGTGCQWNPSHENIFDPDNSGYQPRGSIHITVLGADSLKPLEDATVLIPELHLYSDTGDSGSVSFEDIPADSIWISAFRNSGDKKRPYEIDSVLVILSEDEIAVDTIKLNPLPYLEGSLSVQVLTRSTENPQPIDSATVSLNSLGRFGITDENGSVSFDQISVGTWWLFASKGADSPDTAYGQDSMEVVIEQATETSVIIVLDALPIFSSHKVIAITKSTQDDDVSITYLRLHTTVNDPDGAIDLDRVEWKLEGSDFNLSGLMELVREPDTTYWWDEIPSEDFPNGNLEASLLLPFIFEAFDEPGNSSKSAPALLGRVLHGVPKLESVHPSNPLDLLWTYSNWKLLPDTLSFNYRVLIQYLDQIQERLIPVYDTLLVPPEGHNQNHEVTIDLEPNTYFWEVWVVDNFGNVAISKRNSFTIGP